MDFKNILIIKMSSLGDIIHALPSLYALRKKFPNAKITWAVHPSFAGILPGKPWIDEIYLVDRKKIKSIPYLRTVKKELSDKNFDLVIDLQMIAKSALISFLSGARTKIGYHDAREGSFLINKPIKGKHAEGHIIEQLLDVMGYLGCDTDKIVFPLKDVTTEQKEVKDLLKSLDVQGKFAILVPGTRGEFKKWPISYWAELAKSFSKNNIYSVLVGTPDEKDMGEEIVELAGSNKVCNLIGKTTLLQLVALEKMAALHISADTGPLHIANAVNTPILALFGPTLPDRSGPFGEGVHRVLLANHPGTKESRMDTIKPDEVLKASMDILNTEN